MLGSLVLGAPAGWGIAAAIMPSLRSVDPIGYSPIALIVLLGGAALTWYLLGRSRPRVEA
jgi:hypothetical protein